MQQGFITMSRGQFIAALAVCLLWPSLAIAAVAPGPDAFGYTVAATTNFSFLQITNGSVRVLWFDDDAAVTNINLGFSFHFYGSNYTGVSFNVNGLMTFAGASIAYSNVNLTTTSHPGNLPSIAVLWDDWESQSVDADGVYYKTTGTAGSRQFIVQWNKLRPVNGDGTNTVTFEARLFEGSNRILFSYFDTAVADETTMPPNAAKLGVGATVGIRDLSGQTNNRNLQWSYNQGVITNGLNLLFTPPNHVPAINAATITPSAPTTTNTLLAVVTSATDPDGDPISYTYQWQQSADNATFNNLVGQTASTLNAVWTIAGEYYRVAITPTDGQTNGAPFTTASVRVAVDANGNGINDDWELANFGRIGVDPTADPDGDGMSNLQEFLAGTDPTNAASAFCITSIALEGTDVRVTWTMGSGKTNSLQVTASDATGSYAADTFSDLFTVTNTVGSVTNCLDVSGATHTPARVYRVRLVP